MDLTWNKETIDYFADLYDLNGWAHVAQRVLSFVTYECDLEDGETTQDLFNDLIVKIEDKVKGIDDFTRALKITPNDIVENEWIEAKLLENEQE